MSDKRPRPAWYREWFGEEYLALYPHRDAEEARAAIELVLRVCGRPRGPILDLACGAGRHLQEFRDRGLYVVGLDLSDPLLRQARRTMPGQPLVRADMRELPLRGDSFDLVVNFFTSFGYFSDPEQDRRVLHGIRRILGSGGGFALDFLNAERVRSELVPRDERRVGDRRVVQERHLEEHGEIVAKTIRIYGGDGAEPVDVYQERVRLYEPERLRQMLHEAGFVTEAIVGDYGGAPLTPRSARCILLGRAR